MVNDLITAGMKPCGGPRDQSHEVLRVNIFGCQRIILALLMAERDKLQ
jgi:hypothetical protein